MKFSLISRKISEIPVLELYLEGSGGKRPMVLMLHGLAASKEHVLPYAYHVAREGYYTILPDAHDHGELETAQFKKCSQFEKKSRMFTIIFESSRYIDTIMQAFADDPFVDGNHVGLIGFSMGGMIVYDYLTRLRAPHVKVAIPIIATPEFGKSIRRNIAQDPGYGKYFDEQKISQIEDRQLSNHLSNLKDFPLLILNGELDEIMPIDNIRTFYERAKQNYSQKDLIKLVEYKGIGHIITPEMLSETIEWLKKYL